MICKLFVIGLVFVVMVVSLVMVVDILVCLIIKIDMNLFFVKMKEGVIVKVGEFGIELKFFVGKVDGDYEI